MYSLATCYHSLAKESHLSDHAEDPEADHSRLETTSLIAKAVQHYRYANYFQCACSFQHVCQPCACEAMSHIRIDVWNLIKLLSSQAIPVPVQSQSIICCCQCAYRTGFSLYHLSFAFIASFVSSPKAKRSYISQFSTLLSPNHLLTTPILLKTFSFLPCIWLWLQHSLEVLEKAHRSLAAKSDHFLGMGKYALNLTIARAESKQQERSLVHSELSFLLC